jgi:hypothetical protein
MRPEQAIQLINKVTDNNWVTVKMTLAEVISIVNILLVKRVEEFQYFENERDHISNLLVQKVLLHGASIMKLAEGIDFPMRYLQTPQIKDPFSIHVLFRALLESYLTLYHINFSDSEDENETRFKIWIQYGLRQHGKISFSEMSRENKDQLDDEKKEIDNLLDEISSSIFYSSLDKAKKDTFLVQIERDWKFGFRDNTYLKFSWQQLLENTGVNKVLFSDTYNFLSWFAHSNCISLYQLRDMYKLNGEEQEIKNLMRETSIFIMLAFTDLMQKDKVLKNQYQKLEQADKDLINIYNYVFRDNSYTIEKIKE